MKKRNRIVATLTAAALMVVALQPLSVSAAAEYTMRITHTYPETSAHGKICNEFEKALEELSDGRIDVQIFHNGALASSGEELATVRSGACEATATISQIAMTVNPMEAVWNTPFLMTNSFGEAKWSGALNDNEVIDGLLNKYAAEAGFYRLGDIPTCCGIMLGNNKTPIIDPRTDGKGLNIRTPGGDTLEYLYKQFGFNPMAISGNEVPVALQQGTIDGLATAMYLMYESKWYTKYAYDNTICWSCQPIYVNKDWYDALPEDLQQAVEDAFNVAHEFAVDYLESTEGEYYELLQSEYGVQFDDFNMDDPEIAQWVADTRKGGIEVVTNLSDDDAVNADMQTMIDEIVKVGNEIGYELIVD